VLSYVQRVDLPEHRGVLIGRVALVAGAAFLVHALQAPPAEARGPSTPEERAKAVGLARWLEQDPLAENAAAKRQWLREWIVEVPDIHFAVCADLLGHALGDGYPYSREVDEQVLFSGAAFTIEHRNEARDRVAIYSAGVEGALRAYEVLLKSRPDARSAFLDDLVAKRDRGGLADHVAERAKVKCKKSRLELIAHLVGAGVGLVLGLLISPRFRGDRSHRVEDGATRARIVRRIVFICAAYYLVAAIALQILKSEFDPRFRFMSEYVFGPYGWLMTTTFFVLGLGVLAVVAGLRGVHHSSPSARVGLGLLTVAAVSVCLAGVFKAGIPHLAAGAVTFPGIVMATLLLSRSFWQAAGWQAIHVASLSLALGMLAALVPMVADFGMPGLLQRAFIFLFLVWLSVVAHQLVRASKGA
jgi:hypothetical membrane protein